MNPHFRELVKDLVGNWLNANRQPLEVICQHLAAHLTPLIAGEIERAALKAIGQLAPEEREETALLVGRAAQFVRRHTVQKVDVAEAERLCMELAGLQMRLQESLVVG